MDLRSFVLGIAVAVGVLYLPEVDVAGMFERLQGGGDAAVKAPAAGAATGTGARGAADTRTLPDGRSIVVGDEPDRGFEKITPDTVYPSEREDSREAPTRLWTRAQLKKRDGTNALYPLLISIVGEVYDVGEGKQYYGPGNGYASFAGADNSRGFTTGNYSESGGLSDLSEEQVHGVCDWRTFYRDHDKYVFVGLLLSEYFDENMAPTAELEKVEAMNNAAIHSKNQFDIIQSEYKSCNTRFAANEPQTKVWCSDDWHVPGSTPKFMFTIMKKDIAGNPEKEFGRCACVTKSMMQTAERWNIEPGKQVRLRFVDYPECKPGEQTCFREKGAANPKAPKNA